MGCAFFTRPLRRIADGDLHDISLQYKDERTSTQAYVADESARGDLADSGIGNIVSPVNEFWRRVREH